MKKILTFATCTLTALFMVSCAKNDPRIGELLNEDPSANPNVSIAYLKNAEIPYSTTNVGVLYLVKTDEYKDLKSGIKEVEVPVHITRPLSHDITIEVLEDESRRGDIAKGMSLLSYGDQVTAKVSKVTIKAGQLISSENAVFAIDLKKLNGSKFALPLTLKISDDSKDCVPAHQFSKMDIHLNIRYSLEGLLEVGTSVTPDLKEVKENIEHIQFGLYKWFDPTLFDHDLETGYDDLVYYNFNVSNINQMVSAFSIQPLKKSGDFLKIADAVEVIITDMDGNEQKAGSFKLPEFMGNGQEDNPMIVFKFKKPVEIQGISIRDVNRDNETSRKFSISEFRLYN